MELEEYSNQIEGLTTNEKELLLSFFTSKCTIDQLPYELKELLTDMGYPYKNVKDKILNIISRSTIRDMFQDRYLDPNNCFLDNDSLDEIIILEAEIELRFEKSKDTYIRLGELFCSVKEKLEELHGVDTGVQKGKFGRGKSIFKKWWTERGYNKNLVSNSMKKYRLFIEHKEHPKLQNLIRELGPKPVGLLTQEKFQYKRKLITATLYKMLDGDFKNYDAIEEHLKGRKYNPREVDKLFQDIEKDIKYYTPQDKETLFASLDAIRKQLEMVKEYQRLKADVPTYKLSEE